jgi:protein phosphatase
MTPVHAWRTDAGYVHRKNEDRCFVDAAAGIYLVSDGMANDRAPQVVVDVLPGLICDRIANASLLWGAELPGQLREAFGELNKAVRAATGGVSDDGALLGATVVLALVRGRRAVIAHLGDSRAYLCRDGRLQQLTKDHSLIQELLEQGRITPEEAGSERAFGGPSRFAGMLGEPDPDIQLLNLHMGDRLLLCSDGLTSMMSDLEILTVLNDQDSPEQNCERLIAAAMTAGGWDNITALIVGFTDS